MKMKENEDGTITITRTALKEGIENPTWENGGIYNETHTMEVLDTPPFITPNSSQFIQRLCEERYSDLGGKNETE